MCREIEIYHTGDDPIRVLSTIAKEDDSNCLCGIDIDAMCTEAEFTIIGDDDHRISFVNLAVLHPNSTAS